MGWEETRRLGGLSIVYILRLKDDDPLKMMALVRDTKMHRQWSKPPRQQQLSLAPFPGPPDQVSGTREMANRFDSYRSRRVLVDCIESIKKGGGELA